MSNGKRSFSFTEHFGHKFKHSIELYQMALDRLNNLVHSAGDADYGYCSNKYSVRLITPNDISTFTSNLMKAFRIGMLSYNIDDIQKFAVASAYRFIEEHNDTPFNDTNVLGAFSNQYINPNDFTLTDLLTIAHNEVFPTDLHSNYEIGLHKMNIKEDLKKVNDLHFIGVMKNVVNALPGIIDKSEGVVWMEEKSLLSKVFIDAIESFIMFAILLNTTTIIGMTRYVDPSVSYNTRELGNGDNAIHQESVDTTKNKPVFIVLSEGKTPVLSDTIRWKTKSPISHASISFDPSLEVMWSYGRPSLNPDGTINNVKFGFKNEDITGPMFGKKNITVHVYAIYLPATTVKKMEEYVQGYLGMKTTFDWGAMLQQLLSINKNPSQNKFTRICSTFVNTVLAQADVNITDKKSPAPGDFGRSLEHADEDKVIKVFSGNSAEYKKADTMNKLKKFSEKKTSVTYESFVTECCLLKTDSSIFKTEIPFGCNFKELALGDMTPDFHDLKSSIYYIIKSPKSPIAQLLLKYVNTARICTPDSSLVKNLICKYDSHPELSSGTWYDKRNDVHTTYDMYELYDFHTDVNWLDKIVYGDPAYDTNYRRDNMGNMAIHPILNTLDTIKHAYGCKHLTSNEDVANHIIGVGNVMLGLIRAYERNEISEYMLVKDVLAVLGEIMTCCVIKLYHNNTRVVDNTDSMFDTMAPGYMYTESFVLEADNNSPQVTVSRNETGTLGNKAINAAKNIQMKLSNLISMFVRWIHDNLQKVSSKFAEKHRLEISWVSKNQALNKQIAEALNTNNFNITVNNFPAYNIKLDVLNNVHNFGDKVTEALNKPAVGEKEQAELFKALLPDGINVDWKDTDQTMDLKVQNFVLYGNSDFKPDNTARKIDGKMFTELCDNIVKSEAALKAFTEIGKQLDAAANVLKKRIGELEAAAKTESFEDNLNGDIYQESNNQPNNQQNNQQQNGSTPPEPQGSGVNKNNATNVQNAANSSNDLDKVKNVYAVVTKVSSAYAVKTTNVLINKFYKESYSVYRDIVQGYRQEGPKDEKPVTADDTQTQAQSATDQSGT